MEKYMELFIELRENPVDMNSFICISNLPLSIASILNLYSTVSEREIGLHLFLVDFGG
jgi:hypothetical protein